MCLNLLQDLCLIVLQLLSQGIHFAHFLLSLFNLRRFLLVLLLQLVDLGLKQLPDAVIAAKLILVGCLQLVELFLQGAYFLLVLFE